MTLNKNAEEKVSSKTSQTTPNTGKSKRSFSSSFLAFRVSFPWGLRKILTFLSLKTLQGLM
jgi:hypothetical protein